MPRPKGPQEMFAAIARNLPEKTGKTLDQWVAVARRGPRDPKARHAWLKEKHGLGFVQANVVSYFVDHPDGFEPDAPEELLEPQYAGERAALRPIYDAIAAAARKLGKDVRIEPRQTYVAIVRERQFAVVRATTKDRVDLGFALSGHATTGRLAKAKNLGSARITHFVSLRSKAEVDAEVKALLREACEKGG